MPNFTGKSGGGPSVMKKYGKGKNPILMLGDLDKDGKMSGYETARQTAIEKNTKKSAAPRLTKRMGKIDPNSEGNTDTKEGRSKSSMAQKRVAKAEAPFMKYGESPVKKYKSDAQRMAVHASKADKGSMAKMYGKKSTMKNYKKGYYGA